MSVQTQEKVTYTTVIGLIDNRDQSDAAWSTALSGCCTPAEFTVVMSENSMKRHFMIPEKSASLQGAVAGGAVGVAVGAVAAVLAVAGASIVIPGLGLVIAGPLAAALAGAGAGAAVGGIVGALVGAGVSEAKAKHVQAHLHKGGIAIVAHAATTKVADLIEKEWKTRNVDVVR
ncbi:MAG: hypothetical protein K8T20_03780 [Planctomycetes bacterium]|nr:hypothetical protein [Planctomycetota bacterium]